MRKLLYKVQTATAVDEQTDFLLYIFISLASARGFAGVVPALYDIFKFHPNRFSGDGVPEPQTTKHIILNKFRNYTYY